MFTIPDDRTYLRCVLGARLAIDHSVVVFSNCGIFWDIPGLRRHSPDLAVIFGVKQRKDWVAFYVKKEKVRPSLIIEVTSTGTRVLDVKTKVEQYAEARVPYYVIADAREEPDAEGQVRRRLDLIAYRLKGEAYERVPADQQGRVRLEPVNLLLGVRVDRLTGSDRLVLIDPATNEEIGDYTAVDQAYAAAVKARAAAEARGKVAEAQDQGLPRSDFAAAQARAVASWKRRARNGVQAMER